MAASAGDPAIAATKPRRLRTTVTEYGIDRGPGEMQRRGFGSAAPTPGPTRTQAQTSRRGTALIYNTPGLAYRPDVPEASVCHIRI